VGTLFGALHSPLVSGAVFWPWSIASATPFKLAAGYGVASALLLLIGAWRGADGSAAPGGSG
jgi:hypothetical protein